MATGFVYREHKQMSTTLPFQCLYLFVMLLLEHTLEFLMITNLIACVVMITL